MANPNRPHGFRPVKHLTGAPYNGQVSIYEVPAAESTAVFVGDMVAISTNASTDIYPVCKAGAASGSVTSGLFIGVVTGIVVDPAVLNLPQYRAASTKKFVYVADAPDLIFEAQEDSVGGSIPIGDVGYNVGWIANAGSTSTGASGHLVDSSTVNTTSTLPLRIVGFTASPDNVAGIADTNTRVLVMIQSHQYVGQQTA